MAVQIIREVAADVVKRGSTRAVYAKQHDYNSRFLNVRIQEDGRDIVVASTSKVLLNVERPDKEENIFYGTVNEDGTVRIPMTSWMLELEGTLVCDVSIVSEDVTVAKLTTMQFNIYVEAAVVADEEFIDTAEYSVIVDLLDRTERAVITSEEAARIASEASMLAENAASIILGATAGSTPLIASVENGVLVVRELNKDHTGYVKLKDNVTSKVYKLLIRNGNLYVEESGV